MLFIPWNVSIVSKDIARLTLPYDLQQTFSNSSPTTWNKPMRFHLQVRVVIDYMIVW